MIRDLLKSVWPDWDILEQIGEGGYGVVYKAVRHDLAGTSYAAIKVTKIPFVMEEQKLLTTQGTTKGEISNNRR